MPIPLLKRIGIKIIDLFLLVGALFYLASTTVRTGQFALFDLDFMTLCLIVFGSYVGIIVFISLLTTGIGGGDTAIARFSRSAISGLLMFFLFPWVVSLLLMLCGMRISGDIQLTLTIVAVLRCVISGLLGRHWDVMVP